MHCPFCGSADTRVKDSRPSEDGAAIRRRRSCGICNVRFTTFERIYLRDITVVKRDGKRQAFDRQKLLFSIRIAVNKRQVDIQQIERLANTITRSLLNSGESEISSQTIGEMVVEHLRHVDNVGYIRYASVYHNFKQSEDFEKLLQSTEGSHLTSSNATK